jgi:spoIIIJ-associated protein
VVDAEGDAEKRTDFLARLAKRAADRGAETKRAVALDPMNSRDRRILHVTVKEMEGVATLSVGEGRYRQVVVVPEGADEYAEAVASSNAVSE